MADLKEVVLLTGDQFQTLANGGTVSGETGVNINTKLYLMERTGFEMAEKLCNEASIPSGISTTTSVTLDQAVTAFDLITIMVQSGTAGNYGTATFPSNMYTVYTSSYKLCIKGQSTYYATIYFSDASTLVVSSNRATSIIVYGVDL